MQQVPIYWRIIPFIKEAPTYQDCKWSPGKKFFYKCSPALIQIIIYLQSKAKSKQEIEANANMTTAQIVRLSFKKSWKVQSPLLWYFVAISLFFSMKGQVGCSSTILGLYATKNRLWLNKAFLPPWMFTAQRLVDDYLRDIVWGFKLIG